MPRLSLLFFSTVLSVIAYAQTAPPDLEVAVVPIGLADRGLPYPFGVSYRNNSAFPVSGATLTVTVAGADSLVAAPPGCIIDGPKATCELPELQVPPPAPDRSIFVLFSALAPDQNNATFTMTASIRSREEDATPENNQRSGSARTYRTIFVTNTQDAGSGSLRAAIEEANDSCPPADGSVCKIGFRLPLDGTAWATIRPETPLPALTARLSIDGTTQTRLADSNVHGPEIEINGDRLTAGNGITLAARCGSTVQGLAVNGFPDNGIYIDSPQCDETFSGGGNRITGSYIGTDPAGTKAVPNLRGIFVAPQGQDFYAPTNVVGNVISGNRYSGVWVATGTHTRIAENAIGLNAAHSAGLGNGSSGVYVTRGGSGTDLVNNSIGFNGHYGLSLDAGVAHVQANMNSFQANGNLAIDNGLDGVSPSVIDPFINPANRLHAPAITGARFDAVSDTTVIEGTVDVRNEGNCCRSIYLTFYANDVPDESGFGEGQYLLGTAQPTSEGRFTFVYRGRTPGPWIAATANSFHLTGFGRAPGTEADGGGYAIQTSEFGRTVEVSQ